MNPNDYFILGAVAVAAGLGEHFVSEIDHLAATVEHNKEE